MKWFKHFSDSLDDPFIQDLMDEFGHKGYVAFFGLLEIIAKENGNNLTGELSINPIYLKRKLRISIRVMQQVFNYCATSSKLSVNFSAKKWDFTCPKLLELKDNYTKDLQVTSKKPSIEEEEEEEEDILYLLFEEIFWKPYPSRNGKKIGKAACRKLFMKLTEADLESIGIAVGNYAASKSAVDGYAKDPERFLKKNYWKEWLTPETNNNNSLDMEHVRALENEEELKRKDIEIANRIAK